MASARVALHLKVPEPLRREVQEAARKQGVSINRLCEFALATYLRFLQDDNPPGSDRAQRPSP